VQDSVHPERQARSRRARLLGVATLVSGVLVAGCGGTSGSPTAATVGGASTPASSTASAGPATTAGSSTATGDDAASGASSGSSAGPPGALAFAECMRANGVSNFPDPKPGGGGFDFHASAGIISSPAFKAAQAKCGKLLPSDGPLSPGPPPSAQTMAQLRNIAVCMRQHGVPQFPDPRTSVPDGFNPNPAEYREITNYQGAILLFPATIDPQSPAYEQATAACGAGFLAGNNAH
jgi:hypothetical protein